MILPAVLMLLTLALPVHAGSLAPNELGKVMITPVNAMAAYAATSGMPSPMPLPSADENPASPDTSTNRPPPRLRYRALLTLGYPRGLQ